MVSRIEGDTIQEETWLLPSTPLLLHLPGHIIMPNRLLGESINAFGAVAVLVVEVVSAVVVTGITEAGTDITEGAALDAKITAGHEGLAGALILANELRHA